GPAYIPLERELGLAQAYLEVQAHRMRCASALTVTCPTELSSVEIPCLILLPIAEAAAVGARAAAPRRGDIELSAHVSGPDVILQLALRFDRPFDAGTPDFWNSLEPLTR